MKKVLLSVCLFILVTLVTSATELKRDGWNLIGVCQDINRTDIDMTGIYEIQDQNGSSIYTGKDAQFTNLHLLKAGYGYWVKGNVGIDFESGESTKRLIQPLRRESWNLMACCEDIAQSDINMTDLNELQNQGGEILYTGDWAKYSTLKSINEGYGYWVQGDKDTLWMARSGPYIPPTLADTVLTVEENATTETTVGILTISSKGDANISTIVLSGVGSEKFNVDSNGMVKLNNGKTLDYEGVQIYYLTAIASNAAGESNTVNVTINVTNVIDNVPVLALPIISSVKENISVGTPIITITTNGTNSDENHVDSYTIESGDVNGDFNISDTGLISIAKRLDYERITQYTLKIKATNRAGESTSVEVVIDIEDILDLPEPSYQAINNNGEKVEVVYGNYTIKLFSDHEVEHNDQANHVGVVINLNGSDIPLMAIQSDYLDHNIAVGVYDSEGNLVGVSEIVILDDRTVMNVITEEETNPEDTTPPEKPILLTTIPDVTQEDSVSIQISGEIGSKVYINGTLVNTIGSEGYVTIVLDTTQSGENTYEITLQDSLGNESEPLILTITSTAPKTTYVSNTIELRDALEEAQSNGQNDIIVLAAGTYKTTDDGYGTFTYNSSEDYNLTIKAANGLTQNDVVLDGNSTDRVFQVLSTLSKSYHIIFNRISIVNGKTSSNGAGIYNKYAQNNDITIHLIDSRLSNNTASSSGGGVYSYYGTTIVDNSLVSHNTASSGGGVFSYDGVIVVNDSNISDNSGRGISSNGVIIVHDSVISSNVSASTGGGISGGVIVISNSIVANNTSSRSYDKSSAVYTTYGQIVMYNSQLINNKLGTLDEEDFVKTNAVILDNSKNEIKGIEFLNLFTEKNYFRVKPYLSEEVLKSFAVNEPIQELDVTLYKHSYPSGSLEKIDTNDFDNDGDMDIAYAAYETKLGILVNDGSGNFTSVELLQDAYYVNEVYSADMDNDGDIDIIATIAYTENIGSYDSYLQWFENDGELNFTPHDIYQINNSPPFPSISVEDIDGNGYKDILLVGTTTMGLFKNNGDKTFPYVSIDNYTADRIETNDFNGDGLSDILLCSGAGISWLKNEGNISFTKNIISYHEYQNQAEDINSVDLDKDGDIDIVAANSIVDTFSWYENDGQGNFTLHTTMKFKNETPLSGIYADDIDQDGDVDVIGISENTLEIFMNDGNQNFKYYKSSDYHNSYCFSMQGCSIRTADLNDDGTKEIVTSENWLQLTNFVYKLKVPEIIAPKETNQESVAVTVKAPNGNEIILNGIATGVITSASGEVEVVLDTSGEDGYKNFAFSCIDENSIESDTTNITIIKDTVLPTTPTSPSLIPSITNNSSVNIVINGEVGSSVYINGEEVGVVDSFGQANIVLNTVENKKHNFNISLQDQAGNESEAFSFSIIKDSMTEEGTYVSNTIELREALLKAQSNGKDDVIILKAGVYKTTDDGGGSFTYTSDHTSKDSSLTIKAENGLTREDVVLDGDNINRVFKILVSYKKHLTIFKDVTVTNGYIPDYPGRGGGIYCPSDDSILKILDSNISNNSAYEGGGVHGGKLIVQDSIISNNTASAWGGGVFSYYGSVFVSDSIISNNLSGMSSHIALYTFGKVAIYNSQFINNQQKDYPYNVEEDLTVINGMIIGRYREEVKGLEFTNLFTEEEYLMIKPYLSIAFLEAFDVNDTVEEYNVEYTSHDYPSSSSLTHTNDFDNDGDIDIAYATSSTVGVFVNDGTGNFTTVVAATGISRISDVFSADMDNDGDIDIVTVSETTSTSGDGYTRWYENDGQFNFTKHEIYNFVGDGIDSVYVKDVDGNGYQDILVAGAWDSTYARLLKNNGDKTFTYVEVGYGGDMFGVGADDFDGDSIIDVLVYERSYIAWFKNNGDDSFTKNMVYTSSGSDNGGGAYSADIDSDGDNDIIVANYTDDIFSWHENDGEGGFTTHMLTKFKSESAPKDVYADDIDGDGDIDIVGVSGSFAEIFINDGMQNFKHYKISYYAPNTSSWQVPSIHTADLDGDGIQEIVAGSRWFKLQL